MNAMVKLVAGGTEVKHHKQGASVAVHGKERIVCNSAQRSSVE